MQSPCMLIIYQKTSKLAAPDPFKSTSQAIKEGSRKVGENKLLSRPGSSKNRFQVRTHRDCHSVKISFLWNAAVPR